MCRTVHVFLFYTYMLQDFYSGHPLFSCRRSFHVLSSLLTRRSVKNELRRKLRACNRFLLVISAPVSDGGASLEGADGPGPRPLCSSQCQGTEHICSYAEATECLCFALMQMFSVFCACCACPPGCSGEHSHLRAASQAGGEDSRRAY